MKVIILFSLMTTGLGLQMFSVTPTYREVNPGGTVLMNCVVESMKGECRWEKDGVPIGLYPGKYEMVGEKDGDCTLRILAASMEFDNGVWQCQVTASDFKQKDTLISDGAQLVVRVSPGAPELRKAGGGRVAEKITGRAGEELNLECVSEGGNPAPLLSWRIGGKTIKPSGDQDDTLQTGGYWSSTSRLLLPVSRDDNGATVECILEHSTIEEPSTSSLNLEIYFPPRVELTTSSPAPLPEGASVTLSCDVTSNPPAKISWRKIGLGESILVGSSPNLVLNPVRREDDGSYQCSAENELGLSKPETVLVQVHYAPVIAGLSATGRIEVQIGEMRTLRCHTQGSPSPNIQWLQQTHTGEVLVRGYDEELKIERASYQHQGSFVCSAKNTIGEVQSDPILIDVLGKPEIDRIKVKTEYVLNLGEDLNAVVEFCAKPAPRVTWNLGPVGQADRTVELIAGSTFERFHAGSSHVISEYCFSASLLIFSVRLEDSKEFILQVENDYGKETLPLRVVVIDTRLFTEEVFAAIIVGGVLTILLLSVIIIYVVRIGCCSGGPPKDSGSDRTDLESCRSSTVSHNSHNTIPPDALYGTVKKSYFEPEFNNSKEKLRPDLLRSGENSPYSGRSYSVQQGTINPIGVHSGTLRKTKVNPNIDPKLSGSLRKSGKYPEYRSQGVDCQISSSCQSNSSLDDILYSYSSNIQYKGQV